MLGTHILPTGATGMPLSGTSTSFKKRHQRQSCPVPGFRRASANSFFWGPKLSHGDAQKPGAINQMSYEDCRGQFAARLTSAVAKKFTDILQKSEFEKFQQLLNITFYIKPEGDGEKREITFFDLNGSAKRKAEIERLWACKSYTEVLQLSEEQGRTSSRVEMAVRALRHLLHPLHNEFQGCADAMDMIQQASQGLLSHHSHPGSHLIASCFAKSCWNWHELASGSVYKALSWFPNLAAKPSWAVIAAIGLGDLR